MIPKIARNEWIVLGLFAGLIAGALGGAMQRQEAAKKMLRPRAAAVTLSVGDPVTINGQSYTIGYGLIPAKLEPPPPPPPPPPPVIDVAVYGYRNARRDWVISFHPGETVFIEGKGFGAAAGTVSVNHTSVPAGAWSDSEIRIVCPALPTGAQPGPVPLDVMRADKAGWYSSIGFSIVPLPGGR